MTKIAVCAPASRITREHSAALQDLVSAEFPQHSVTFHEQCFASAGHFAGTDLERLEALVELANEPQFDAVWFARGGYGSNRIAEAAIARMGDTARSKTYVGFSDMGYLLGGLYRNSIGQQVHGPMPVSARSDTGREGVRRVLRWFSGDGSGLEPSLDGQKPTVAFNLMTLTMLTNTRLMPDLAGHILMVEEVSEHLYAIDRMFFHLAGTLPRIAGLRLGAINDIPQNDREFGQDAEEIAKFWCARAGIPFLGRADIGHVAGNMIVPFGLASPSTAS